MAIKFYSRFIVVVDTVEEFHAVYDRIEGEEARIYSLSKPQPEAVLEDDGFTGDVLERAMNIAQGYIDRFEPFTYEDVGLPIELRNYRTPFREWAEVNGIKFDYSETPEGKGFQSAVFRPFRIDEQGKETLAKYPEEE